MPSSRLSHCNFIWLSYVLYYSINNNQFNDFIPKIIMLSIRTFPYYITKNEYLSMILWNLSYLIHPIFSSPNRIYYVVSYIGYLIFNSIFLWYTNNSDYIKTLPFINDLQKYITNTFKILFYLALAWYYYTIDIHVMFGEIKLNIIICTFLLIMVETVFKVFMKNSTFLKKVNKEIILCDFVIWNPAFIYFYIQSLHLKNKALCA